MQAAHFWRIAFVQLFRELEDEMGKHTLRINVTDQPKPNALVSARSLSFPRRLARRIFGTTSRVAIVIPGRQVGKVEILEPDDDLMALADAVQGGED